MEGLPILYEFLPCYVPKDEHGNDVLVSTTLRKPKKVEPKTRDTGYHMQAVSNNFEMSDAIREIVQNLLDAVSRANNRSYNGITFSRGNKKDRILIHNGVVIYGAIIMGDGTLTFVNYGPIITDMDEFLVIGKSSKVGENAINQSGQFGEGLKRAVLYILTKGLRIWIDMPLTMDRGEYTELRHLGFCIGKERDTLCVKIKPREAKEIDMAKETTLRQHCFQLTIRSNGATRLDFDIFSVLVPKSAMFRSVRDANDKGCVSLDDDIRGKVYVRNIFVTDYLHVYMRYAYNLYVHIGRDRNVVDHNTLINAIVHVWNYEILTNPDGATTVQFCHDVVCNTDDNCVKWYEVHAVGLLSPRAMAILRRISCGGSDTVRPIREQDAHAMQHDYCISLPYFQVLPNHAVAAMTKTAPLKQYCDNMEQELVTLPGHAKVVTPYLDNVWIKSSGDRCDRPIKHAVMTGVGGAVNVYLSHQHWSHCVTADGVVTNAVVFCTKMLFDVVRSNPAFDRLALITAIMTPVQPPPPMGSPPPQAFKRARSEEKDEEEEVEVEVVVEENDTQEQYDYQLDMEPRYKRVPRVQKK